MITADHVALAVYTAARVLETDPERVLLRVQSLPASRVRMYAARALRRIEPTISAATLMRVLGHPAHGKVQRDKNDRPDGGATSFMSMVYIAHTKPWWSGATFEAVVAALDGRAIPFVPSSEAPKVIVCPADGQPCDCGDWEGNQPCHTRPVSGGGFEPLVSSTADAGEKIDMAPDGPTAGAGALEPEGLATQPPAVEPQPAATPAPYKPRPLVDYTQPAVKVRPKLLKAQKRHPEKTLPGRITAAGTAAYGGMNEPAGHKTGLQRMLEEALINTAKQQAAERNDD